MNPLNLFHPHDIIPDDLIEITVTFIKINICSGGSSSTAVDDDNNDELELFVIIYIHTIWFYIYGINMNIIIIGGGLYQLKDNKYFYR